MWLLRVKTRLLCSKTKLEKKKKASTSKAVGRTRAVSKNRACVMKGLINCTEKMVSFYEKLADFDCINKVESVI